MQPASPRQEPTRSALGFGAAQAAPTAPHATPHAEAVGASGPERFWARRPTRIALAASVVVSGIVHATAMPFGLPQGFEVRDQEGDVAIPIDVLEPERLTASEPPAEDPGLAERKDKENESLAGATAPAGTQHDAGLVDSGVADSAATDAPADSPGDAHGDGAAISDAAIAAASSPPDGGTKAGPEGIVEAEGIRADVVLVSLFVNAQVIRKHPAGARIGALLRGIPQWDDFVSGTDIDPVRDIDWVLISGPSLINTARDLVVIHYAISDATVDRAVALVSRKYDRGGAFDAGVRGVKASLAHADKAERVILRPQSHLLAVVPPSRAEALARALVAVRFSDHLHPGEAVSLRLVNPHHPMPEVPEAITVMRLRVLPRTDEGADVVIEGDTDRAEAASAAADSLRSLVRRHNDGLTSLLTHGLLDHVEVGADDKMVTVALTATRDQIETLVSLVGGFLGVPPAPVSGPPPILPPPAPLPEGPSRPWQSR